VFQIPTPHIIWLAAKHTGFTTSRAPKSTASLVSLLHLPLLVAETTPAIIASALPEYLTTRSQQHGTLMSSYFDVRPPSKATVEPLDVPDDHPLKSTGMLTPQVSRILDDFDWEEHSGSDEDPDGEKSLSEDSDPEPEPSKLRKSQSSPLPKTKHVTIEPPPKPLGVAQRQRHPHLARFHSLRSMLFSSRIEEEKIRHDEARAEAEAEEKWRADHEHRKGLNRPKTPESPKGSPTKESFTHRMGDKLRRMTSKEPPTMKGIMEENDVESTASSEDDDERMESIRVGHGSDGESINHSDVEDLMRWVSRRDPPSDGELRRNNTRTLEYAESDHESLGHSDVEDLVAHAHRKFSDLKTEAAVDQTNDYSDASTQEDSEAETRKKTGGDEDAGELLRWISHKDGPNAGPLREKKEARPSKPVNSNDTEKTHNSDAPELARWVSRRDDTSGESDFPGDETSSTKPSVPRESEEEAGGSLAPKDVDELVRWVSRKDSKSPQLEVSDEEPRGRSPIREDNAPMTHEDANELMRTISRRESNPRDEEARDDSIMKWKKEEDEKRREVGMSHDNGSLQPDDVDELVRWVSKKS
jgi:hypothetical protein